MHNGSLLIDMHVHLAQYEVLSASTQDWFISLYPSEAAYQAVCEANASPDDFCAMLAEKGVDYAVILAEDTPAVTDVADNRMVADFCKGHPQLLPFCTFDPLKEKDMPGQLRQLAAEGFRGVKLYPTYNFFYPNTPMMYPLYETAQELDVPHGTVDIQELAAEVWQPHLLRRYRGGFPGAEDRHVPRRSGLLVS